MHINSYTNTKTAYFNYIHAVAHALILCTFFIVVVVVVFVILKHYCVHCAIISFPYLNKTIWFIFTVLCMMMGFVDVMISLCFFFCFVPKRKEGSCAKRMCHQLIYSMNTLAFLTHLIRYSIGRWIVHVHSFEIFFFIFMLVHNLGIVCILECVRTWTIWLYRTVFVYEEF